VFPILYVDVPDLESQERRDGDTVLSIVAQRQYVDWRQLRHHDVNTRPVGEAVEQLCLPIRNALRRSQPSDAELQQRRRDAEEREQRLAAEQERRDTARRERELTEQRERELVAQRERDSRPGQIEPAAGAEPMALRAAPPPRAAPARQAAAAAFSAPTERVADDKAAKPRLPASERRSFARNPLAIGGVVVGAVLLAIVAVGLVRMGHGPSAEITATTTQPPHQSAEPISNPPQPPRQPVEPVAPPQPPAVPSGASAAPNVPVAPQPPPRTAALPPLVAEISGAGATFPYPIYAKWAELYKKQTGTALDYQSIGSGGGIKQITAKTVDFGASDMPLQPDELNRDGLQQWPAVMGGLVFVVNLPGMQPGQLRLDGKTIAGIYLGTIKNWNDKAIVALNPGLRLPDKAIAVVHRSDGSPATFIFAHYLSGIDQDFRTKLGEDFSLEFPVGIGGKGNAGVAAFTTQTEGAIGYVEYAYALQNKLTYALLKNHDGNFVSPTAANIQAAAANADWSKAPGFYLLLTDQPGKDSWPITAATFILMHKQPENAASATTVLRFFDWAYRNGGAAAADLDYVPMPAGIVGTIEQSWNTIVGSDGTSLWPRSIMIRG
jgi:phosphate transport system substrate-binding protein